MACIEQHCNNIAQRLAGAPQILTEDNISSMEEFTVLLYDKTATQKSVDELRLMLLTQKGRQMMHLTPTKGALEQHIMRGVLPPPDLWGWSMRNIQWTPFWTSNSDAASSCAVLIRCKCRSKCVDCNYVKARLFVYPILQLQQEL